MDSVIRTSGTLSQPPFPESLDNAENAKRVFEVTGYGYAVLCRGHYNRAGEFSFAGAKHGWRFPDSYPIDGDIDPEQITYREVDIEA